MNQIAIYMVEKKYAEKSFSYSAYKEHLEKLLQEGKTTGSDQSADMVEYATMNMQRMNRLDKTAVINDSLKEIISQIKNNQHWFVLTEGWCGDAAQIVPVLGKIAELNSKIKLHLLLRDENLELMDKYLTNGRSRSIPKLIVTDENFQEIFNWGPRPKEAQDLLDEWKNSDLPFEQVSTNLHAWYAKNKTVAIQEELTEKLNEK